MEGLDTTIQTHPERLHTVAEADEGITKLTRFKEQTGLEGVVVVIQNLQLGGSYVIRSKEEAIARVNDPPGPCERYSRVYGMDHYLSEREKLLQKKQ